MSTYLITKEQIQEVFEAADYVETVENAFKLMGSGQVQMPAKVYLSFPRGDVRCMPVYIPSMNIAGVKNVNVHPHNKDMPSVMATITLFNPDTGYPTAIMDGTHITDMRTGAAGAVAAKYLARKDSKTAAFIGAGAQSRTQLRCLHVTTQIENVLISDPNELNSIKLMKLAESFGLNAEIVKSVDDATKDADIVVTTTPVREPIVEKVKPGTHINAIGADAEGKEELNPEILKCAVIVIDNWEQASHSGEINVPLKKGIINKDSICADIGEIVTGKSKSRENNEQITVFDSTGLAIQDVSSAFAIFQKLDKNKLTKFDFMQ